VFQTRHRRFDARSPTIARLERGGLIVDPTLALTHAIGCVLNAPPLAAWDGRAGWATITQRTSLANRGIKTDLILVTSKAQDVLDVLSELMLIRGVPGHIRSDNGPEFIAQAIQRFLEQTGVKTLYIEPGAPWQNGYAESFNSRFRAEVLSRESFADLAEAKQVSDWWKNHYNHRRPHSSLGYQTPAAYAASLAGPALRLGAAPLTCAPARQAIESVDHTPTLIGAGT